MRGLEQHAVCMYCGGQACHLSAQANHPFINTLQSVINTLQSVINTLQSVINTLQSVINTLQSVINTLQSVINTLQSVINALQSVINALQSVLYFTESRADAIDLFFKPGPRYFHRSSFIGDDDDTIVVAFELSKVRALRNPTKFWQEHAQVADSAMSELADPCRKHNEAFEPLFGATGVYGLPVCLYPDVARGSGFDIRFGKVRGSRKEVC